MLHRKILISGKRPLDRSEFKQIHVICRKVYEPLRSCPSCLQAEPSSFVVWEKARQEWMEGCRHAGGQWTSGGGPRKILTSFSASIYLLSRIQVYPGSDLLDWMSIQDLNAARLFNAHSQTSYLSNFLHQHSFRILKIYPKKARKSRHFKP